MSKFIVEVPEVHYSLMKIEAETAEEAAKLVRVGDGDEVFCEYSHTLDQNYKVKDANGNYVYEETLF